MDIGQRNCALHCAKTGWSVKSRLWRPKKGPTLASTSLALTLCLLASLQKATYTVYTTKKGVLWSKEKQTSAAGGCLLPIWWENSRNGSFVPKNGPTFQKKWCHMVAKFSTNASGAIWWIILQRMQVTQPGGSICN